MGIYFEVVERKFGGFGVLLSVLWFFGGTLLIFFYFDGFFQKRNIIRIFWKEKRRVLRSNYKLLRLCSLFYFSFGVLRGGVLGWIFWYWFVVDGWFFLVDFWKNQEIFFCFFLYFLSNFFWIMKKFWKSLFSQKSEWEKNFTSLSIFLVSIWIFGFCLFPKKREIFWNLPSFLVYFFSIFRNFWPSCLFSCFFW